MWNLLKRTLYPWRAGRSKERRVERRHRVTYQGKLTLQGETVPAALEDVTGGGTRVRSARKLTVGQAVVVTFPCGPREAICRWCRLDGDDWVSGLQFARDSNTGSR